MYLHPVCKLLIISGAGLQTITDHPVGSNHKSPHKRDRANVRAKSTQYLIGSVRYQAPYVIYSLVVDKVMFDQFFCVLC